MIEDFNGKEIVGKYHEKELRKPNETEFRTEKVLKQKGDEIHAKWKGYGNLLIILIDK